MAFKLRIGSRPSQLALVQAEIVRAALGKIGPDLTAEIVPIKTSGDRMTSASLARVGGKGLFIRELEQALQEKRIDIAVHSMKDLPAVLASEFRIAAVPEREDARDVLVTRAGGSLAGLARGTRLGTSSLRRKYLALRINAGLAVSSLRGNVDTRLKHVADGALDAIIIAMAGLKRLGRVGSAFSTPLDEKDFIPAGGQAALAVETLADGPREHSRELERALDALNDARARFETAAERAFLATLGASCVTPVGVKATVSEQSITVRAVLFSNDGTRELSDETIEALDVDLAPSAAEAVGAHMGERMLARGADRLIDNE